MGLRQELTTTTAPATEAPPPPPPPPPAASAAAAGAPPPEGTMTVEPDLKKRKKNEEQKPTRPPLPDATGAVVAAAGAACAAEGEPGTLGKHVTADASSSSDNDDSTGGSKKTKKRKADQVTTDGEEASSRLFSVDAASCTAVESKGHGGSTDKKDDADQVQVHQLDDGSPLRIPPMKKNKKLLILDLNGLLADINQDKHNAHLSQGKFRGKLVFKRPYCDDFLRFCIHHFELGIWSSRLRANVDAVVDILMKDLKHHLLFCWEMSKCTGTGLNTLENNGKPLVLKEMKKLWDRKEPDLPWQQGDFSPSNTLLVDDSPYKALRNLPHTAIFPCPYSYKNDKDDALGPGGDLRLYLENLAIADDVTCYVREHPFGQPPITETDPDWEFYRQVLLLQ